MTTAVNALLGAATLPIPIITGLPCSLPSQYLRSIWPAVLIHGLAGVILVAVVRSVFFCGLT